MTGQVAADGKMGMKTQLAIGKFQQANNMPITGQPLLALAVAISSQVDAVRNNTALSPAAEPPPAAATLAAGEAVDVDEHVVVKTRQQCLEESAARAQAKAKKRRFLGALAQIGTQVAAQFGGYLAAATEYDAANVASLAAEFRIPEADASECLQLPE